MQSTRSILGLMAATFGFCLGSGAAALADGPSLAGLRATAAAKLAAEHGDRALSPAMSTIESLDLYARTHVVGPFEAAGGIAGGSSCTLSGANCQDGNQLNALGSTGLAGNFRVLDDFTPAGNGSITNICVTGAYLPSIPTGDNFTVQYFANNNGLPGASIGGPFSQSGGTLTLAPRFNTGLLLAGIAPEFQHSMTHAAVSVQAGQCYWVQVLNAPPGSNWFWEDSNGGNGRSLSIRVNDGNVAAAAPDRAMCLSQTLGDSNLCLGGGSVCTLSGGNCQSRDNSNALLSRSNDTDTAAFTADDFSPSQSGDVTSICWWGVYVGCATPTDNFTITYFANDAAFGLPGAVIGGPFNVTPQRVTTGQLVAQAFQEFEYTATHAAVNVQANQCYWVEIRNTLAGGCDWFWEQGSGGNARSTTAGLINTNDLAYCLSVDLGGNIFDCVPAAETVCTVSGANCQTRVNTNGALSSSGTITADDFTPSTSGNITNICFWGGYDPCRGPDNFTITYRQQTLVGEPGTIIASFSQSGGSLTVTPPAVTGAVIADAIQEFEYSATHAAVAVVAGQCYWVEISNGTDAGCDWFWEDASPTTGRIAQNGVILEGNQAFCVSVELGDAGACDLPTGRCCVDLACSITTQGDCAAQGGQYGGDATDCNAFAIILQPNVAIPDNNPTGITSQITVPDPLIIEDLNVGLLIAHTWQGDLIVTLTAPDGTTTATLVNRPGAPQSADGFSQDNFGDPTAGTFFVLDDEAAIVYDDPDVAAPGTLNPTGAFKPDTGPLTVFDGLDVAGTWTLRVSDNVAGDVGTLIAWALIPSGANPCANTDPCAGSLRGDANCDGRVNNVDIDFFVNGLIDDPVAFVAQGGTQACFDTRNCWGDIDHSDAFNNFDIQPFVDCILNLPPDGQPCAAP